ncbi:MAG: hypothetical protein ABSH41_10030 [Syntrophobacteraceae bacterium]|jgi:hypothetical protein
MNISQLKWAGIAIAIGCSVLLYPYYRSTLKMYGYHHPQLYGISAVLIVSVALSLLVASIIMSSKRHAYYLAAFSCAVCPLLWRNVHWGVGAAIGVGLVQAFVLVLFAWAILVNARESAVRLRSGSLMASSTFWCGAILFASVATITVIWFYLSHFVWFWDYVVYDKITKVVALDIRQHGLHHMLQTVKASLSYEYNYVPALPLALAEWIFGRSDRLFLILAISIVYVAPTIISLSYLLHIVSGRRLNGCLSILFSCLALSVYPVIFISPLRGMPDIGGVAILVWLTVNMHNYQSDGTLKINRIASLVAAGGLIFLLCVFRRWYTFIAIPIVLIILCREMLITKEGDAKYVRIVDASKGIVIFLSYMTLCGFAFYWERLMIMANSHYSEAFRAYAGNEFEHAIFCIGYGPAMIGVLAIALLAWRRQTRLVAVSLVFTLTTSVFLFTHIQGFGNQHYLFFLPVLSFAIGAAVTQVYLRRPNVGYVLTFFLALCSLLAMISVFNPQRLGKLQTLRVLSNIDMRPPQRSDMEELSLMVHDLGTYASAGKNVCVAASGMQFNQSIVFEVARNSKDPMSSALMDRFLWLGDVDRRDGPAIAFPSCDYVVITEPVSTHLSIREQQVIVYLADSIKAGTGLGANYRKTGHPYSLMDKCQALVYEKVTPMDNIDWNGYVDAVNNK